MSEYPYNIAFSIRETNSLALIEKSCYEEHKTIIFAYTTSIKVKSILLYFDLLDLLKGTINYYKVL